MKNPVSKIITSLLYFFTLILFSLYFLGCTSAESTENEDQQISLSEAKNILVLVNNARADEGLNPIVLNDALNQAAYKHSLDMDTNNYFSHTGSN